MGSPVSLVVANIYVENFEDLAVTTAPDNSEQTPVYPDVKSLSLNLR